MKKFEIASDNMGGLRSVMAIPEKSFWGINKTAEYGKIRNELLTGNTENIILFDCLWEGYSFSEKSKDSDSGITYEIKVAGTLPGDSHVSDELIRVLQLHKFWIILVTDQNNNIRLCGSHDVRMLFSFERNTGNNQKSLNHTTFTFDCTASEPSEFIDSLML